MTEDRERGDPVPPSVSPAVAIKQSTRADSMAEFHKLKYKWVLFCSKSLPSSKSAAAVRNQQDWDHKPVTDFESIEQFWSLMNFLEEDKTEIFSHYVDICVFRDGIQPDWDDPHNKDGGCIAFSDAKCDNCEAVFKYFLPISLLMVGHQFGDAASSVNGLFISRKPAISAKQPNPWSIEIWLKSSSVKKRHLVADRVIDELALPLDVDVKWYLHAKKKKSFVNLRKKSATAEEPDAASSTTPSSASSSSPTASEEQHEDPKKKETNSEEDD